MCAGPSPSASMSAASTSAKPVSPKSSGSLSTGRTLVRPMPTAVNSSASPSGCGCQMRCPQLHRGQRPGAARHRPARRRSRPARLHKLHHRTVLAQSPMRGSPQGGHCDIWGPVNARLGGTTRDHQHDNQVREKSAWSAGAGMTRGQGSGAESPSWLRAWKPANIEDAYRPESVRGCGHDHFDRLLGHLEPGAGLAVGRHLLDPVGSESVADVVRRLGAVLSMDESLAELAVRTRRTRSRSGELAKALADGTVIKAFVPRVDALPLARGRRHLPRAPIGRAAVGVAELGGVLPAQRI